MCRGGGAGCGDPRAGRRKVGDPRRRHHPEALLRGSHDARGGRQLRHLETEAVVARLGVGGDGLQLPEPQLTLRDQNVEGHEAEEQGRDQATQARCHQPGPAAAGPGSQLPGTDDPERRTGGGDL